MIHYNSRPLLPSPLHSLCTLFLHCKKGKKQFVAERILMSNHHSVFSIYLSIYFPLHLPAFFLLPSFFYFTSSHLFFSLHLPGLLDCTVRRGNAVGIRDPRSSIALLTLFFCHLYYIFFYLFLYLTGQHIRMHQNI